MTTDEVSRLLDLHEQAKALEDHSREEALRATRDYEQAVVERRGIAVQLAEALTEARERENRHGH